MRRISQYPEFWSERQRHFFQIDAHPLYQWEQQTEIKHIVSQKCHTIDQDYTNVMDWHLYSPQPRVQKSVYSQWQHFTKHDVWNFAVGPYLTDTAPSALHHYRDTYNSVLK